MPLSSWPLAIMPTSPAGHFSYCNPTQSPVNLAMSYMQKIFDNCHLQFTMARGLSNNSEFIFCFYSFFSLFFFDFWLSSPAWWAPNLPNASSPLRLDVRLINKDSIRPWRRVGRHREVCAAGYLQDMWLPLPPTLPLTKMLTLGPKPAPDMRQSQAQLPHPPLHTLLWATAHRVECWCN